MSRTTFFVSALVFAVSASTVGCAGMIAGSSSWFDRQREDVEPKATADLSCGGQSITYAPVKMDDYREVEARGCGKKVKYDYVKVGPVGKWSKAGDVTQM